MASRILVGNRRGVVLAELDVEIESVSWRINDIGICRFQVPIKDPKANERNLRQLNRVLVQFENGLPNWGGVISLPRTWNGQTVSITAYSPEKVLENRLTASEEQYEGEDLGNIFAQLIQHANTRWDSGLELGDYYFDGGAHEVEFNYSSVLDVLRETICGALSTAEYEPVAIFQEGRILFKLSLWEQRGKDKSDAVSLVEAQNVLQGGRVQEQGPIINRWYVAGSGSSWDDNRLVGSAESGPSIGSLGLQETAGVFPEIEDQATLDTMAANFLEHSTRSRYTFELPLVDRAPGEFKHLRPGDTVTILLPSYGFGGIRTTARIRTMEYAPAEGILKVVLQ